MKMLFVPLLKCVFCAAVDNCERAQKFIEHSTKVCVCICRRLTKQKNRIEKQQNQRSESFCAPKMIPLYLLHCFSHKVSLEQNKSNNEKTIHLPLSILHMDLYGVPLLSQNGMKKIDVNNYIDHEIKYRQ